MLAVNIPSIYFLYVLQLIPLALFRYQRLQIPVSQDSRDFLVELSGIASYEAFEEDGGFNNFKTSHRGDLQITPQYVRRIPHHDCVCNPTVFHTVVQCKLKPRAFLQPRRYISTLGKIGIEYGKLKSNADISTSIAGLGLYEWFHTRETHQSTCYNSAALMAVQLIGSHPCWKGTVQSSSLSDMPSHPLEFSFWQRSAGLGGINIFCTQKQSNCRLEFLITQGRTAFSTHVPGTHWL